MKTKHGARKAPGLLDLLVSQGLGSRRECLSALLHDEVQTGYPGSDGIAWTVVKDAEASPALENLHLRCGVWELPYFERLYLALHKPANMECSRSPTSHASVLDFFPAPFLKRGLQPVGRLDADATGLLLLTDDGDFNHVVTSPRRKLPKTYRIGLRHDLTQEQQQSLETGVILKDDPRPTLPAQIQRLSDREVEITITEGRYHQVKRMLGAVGNRVDSIHRLSVGGVSLGDLEAEKWRHLSDEEAANLRSSAKK